MDKNQLLALNVFSLLNLISKSSTTEANIEEDSTPGQIPVRIEMRSLASGNLRLRHANENAIEISENGLSKHTLGNLQNERIAFQIIQQPQNHFCRLVNPDDVWQENIVLEINCFSVISLSHASGGILPGEDRLVIRFSDSLDFDINESVLDSTLEPEDTVNPLVSTTSIENDTLTIEAIGRWIEGINRFVEFRFQSQNGDLLAIGDLRLEYTVAGTIRYVAEWGDDINPGTSANSPRRNIQAAINELGSCANPCGILAETANTNFQQNISTNPQLSSPLSPPYSFFPPSNSPCTIARSENILTEIIDDIAGNDRPTGSPPTVTLGSLQSNLDCL